MMPRASRGFDRLPEDAVPCRSAPQFDGAAVEIQIVAGNCGDGRPRIIESKSQRRPIAPRAFTSSPRGKRVS
jgi:hypothetical protein